MREAPSAYIFESDGTVHRQRSFDSSDLPLISQSNETADLAAAAK